MQTIQLKDIRVLFRQSHIGFCARRNKNTLCRKGFLHTIFLNGDPTGMGKLVDLNSLWRDFSCKIDPFLKRLKDLLMIQTIPWRLLQFFAIQNSYPAPCFQMLKDIRGFLLTFLAQNLGMIQPGLCNALLFWVKLKKRKI